MSLRTILCASVAGFLALALVTPANARQAKGKKFALLVGINEYDNAAFANLKYAENDVEQLAAVLATPGAGFSGIVLLTTTRGKKDENSKPMLANIRIQLKKLTEKVTKHDTILIAFSGHGLQIEVNDNGKMVSTGFLCPSDARPMPGRLLADNKRTMIAVTDLFKDLGDSGAGTQLMLVDAARMDIARRGQSNLDVDALPRPPSGLAALFSCKGSERAFESEKLGKGHGVFFHYTLEALKGKAKNDKGEVTWNRLAEYVIDKVSEDVPTLIGGGAKQTPQELKNIIGRSPLLTTEKK